MIEAMLAATGKNLPDGLGGGIIREPLGMVLTGDLADDNRLEQWNQFDSIWSANGDGEIRYPVFEGLSNHDFHAGRKEVRAAMLERHQDRVHTILVAKGEGAHYSWDWNDVPRSSESIPQYGRGPLQIFTKEQQPVPES
jgi:cytolysin (calcineurin-like family phosphatase)